MVEQKPGQGIRKKNNQQLSAQSSVDRLRQRWEDLPHEELVEMMRATLDEAKEHWEALLGEGSFDRSPGLENGYL